MKKETQFLCIILLCGLSLMSSGCGIMPSKLISPTEAAKEKQDEVNNGAPSDKTKEAVAPTFPAVYPKAAR
jgi:hypothetical protein